MKEKFITEIKTTISKALPVPLYNQLQGVLEEMITDSRLSSGELLPGDLDFAKLLGVSPATIRKSYSILEEKGFVKRIKSVGTLVADDLIKKKPVIGFFYNLVSAQARYRIAEYAQQCLASHGYDLKIVAFADDFYENHDLYTEAQNMHLEGLIAVPLDSPASKESFLRLDEVGFPYVRLANDLFQGELRGCLVRSNESQSVVCALKYLEQHGHTKIGLLSAYDGDDAEVMYRRLHGKHIDFENRWIASPNFHGTYEQWRKSPSRGLLKKYLLANRDLTAVMIENVPVCIDLLTQARAMGLAVPDDLSLVVLGSFPGLDLATPRITSMEWSHQEMAEWAVNKLLEAIEKGLPQVEQVIKVSYDLRERESVVAPRGFQVAEKQESGEVIVGVPE